MKVTIYPPGLPENDSYRRLIADAIHLSAIKDCHCPYCTRIRQRFSAIERARPDTDGVALTNVSHPTHFCFLTQRPCDSEPWPLIYTDRDRAEKAPHRVSPVVPVCLVPQPAQTPEQHV